MNKDVPILEVLKTNLEHKYFPDFDEILDERVLLDQITPPRI